jgi:hypothetical protein
LKIVAATLAKSDEWFLQFRSFSDVAEQFRIRSGLPSAPTGTCNVVGVLNYGLLLLLAGDKQEAVRWLRFTGELLSRPRYWDAKARTFYHEQAPGLKLMMPTKDDERYRKLVDSALAKAES